MRKWCAFLVVACLLAVLFGCGSARRGEPLTGPMDISSKELQEGQKVFMTHCYQCHPGGEAGIGPALNNKPLPGFLVKFQVRHGLGAMPTFPDKSISDDELDALITYIKALRHKG